MNDLAKIPATPLYLLMVQTDEESGLALTIDGQRIDTDSDIGNLRTKGLAELRIRAALAARPIRARAVEPAAPTPWNMIVFPDGAVTDVAEHPAPPPVAEEHKQEWAAAWAAHAAEHPELLTEPAPPARATATDNPPRPALTAPPATLVPETHREQWAAVWAARAAGDVPTAVALAYKLEVSLAGQFGDLDPSTVTVLTARAWLTLCQRTDWQGTTELLITTALRCQAAKYRPEADTMRTARNAHAAWHVLREEDPEAAADLAAPLADMLAILGEEQLHRDVLDRSREAAATGAG